MRYGWRGKFGFITPSICDTVLLEFYKILPEGVLVTPVDLKIQNLVDKEFDQAISNIFEAVKVLCYEEVELIIVGGTPPIIRAGIEKDVEIINRISAETGKLASTTPTAELRAIKALGLKKIAVVTPLVPQQDELIKSYLTFHGLDVLKIKGLNIVKNVDITKVPLETIYSTAKETFYQSEGAEGVFIECPRWATVDIISALESDLGVPVVTSAQAIIWEALRLLNIHEAQAGYGKLLELLCSKRDPCAAG